MDACGRRPLPIIRPRCGGRILDEAGRLSPWMANLPAVVAWLPSERAGGTRPTARRHPRSIHTLAHYDGGSRVKGFSGSVLPARRGLVRPRCQNPPGLVASGAIAGRFANDRRSPATGRGSELVAVAWPGCALVSGPRPRQTRSSVWWSVEGRQRRSCSDELPGPLECRYGS